MPERPPSAAENEVLSGPIATRLLDRASTLDAAMREGTRLADLRAAATEAGISERAFEAALAELQSSAAPAAESAALKHARRRWRFWAFTTAVVVMTVIAFLVTASTVVPRTVETPTERR